MQANRYPTWTMQQSLVPILLAVNLAVSAAIATFVFSRPAPQSEAETKVVQAEAPTVNVDFTSLKEPVENLNANLDQLTSTIQRFNTSLIQYDYLKGEMDRLGGLDRTIGLRAQAALAQATEENAEDTKAAIAKLQELSAQVQGEQQARRQTMLQLISGLERQLANLSGSPVAPPASPTPAPETEPETGTGVPSEEDTSSTPETGE